MEHLREKTKTQIKPSHKSKFVILLNLVSSCRVKYKILFFLAILHQNAVTLQKRLILNIALFLD